ncbi:MAG: Asp/Glu racemase [Pseudomonadota bacterium]|nr:Asp/Glu racemase [Pseudomonadota bacterium]
MSFRTFPFDPVETFPTQLGLIVLQSDETIEQDFRRLFGPEVDLQFSRIASGADVTPETLAAMEGDLGASAELLCPWTRFGAIGYGCTSGTAQIGRARVAELVSGAAQTGAVTEPVSALLAACEALGIRRIAFLSPYLAEVSDRICEVLAQDGVETPLFGSFNVATEARVARISPASIMAAARQLVEPGGVDALFLSCTNLRALGIIDALEAELDMPVLSSNLVLAWHMARLAGVPLAPGTPGRLARV